MPLTVKKLATLFFVPAVIQICWLGSQNAPELGPAAPANCAPLVVAPETETVEPNVMPFSSWTTK